MSNQALEADYLRGYATALIDAIAALTYARDAGGEADAAHDGLNAAIFVIRQMRPPAYTGTAAKETEL